MNQGRKRASTVLAVYWAVLFISTHVPLPVLPESPAGSDKGVHFLAYGILAFLFRRARTRPPMLTLWFVIALYAIFDECTQPLVNRSMEIADMTADGVGAALGLIAAKLWPKKRMTSLPQRSD